MRKRKRDSQHPFYSVLCQKHSVLNHVSGKLGNLMRLISLFRYKGNLCISCSLIFPVKENAVFISCSYLFVYFKEYNKFLLQRLYWVCFIFISLVGFIQTFQLILHLTSDNVFIYSGPHVVDRVRQTSSLVYTEYPTMFIAQWA